MTEKPWYEEKQAVTLRRLDWGKLLDGLEQRAETWENTAHVLRGGLSDLPIEECSDSEEAEDIAASYRSIIEQIRHQTQGGSYYCVTKWDTQETATVLAESASEAVRQVSGADAFPERQDGLWASEGQLYEVRKDHLLGEPA